MRFRLQLIALPLATLLIACGGGGDGTTGPSSGNPNNPPPGTPEVPIQTNAVQVANNLFSPANIQVSPGTTVTWTWAGASDTHNVTFADGVNSGNKGPGSAFSRTFNNAGTFNYQCTLHPGMTGSVLVK